MTIWLYVCLWSIKVIFRWTISLFHKVDVIMYYKIVSWDNFSYTVPLALSEGIIQMSMLL